MEDRKARHVAAVFACLLTLGSAAAPARAQDSVPHNLVLFVPDGLRASIVDATTAPALDALRREGVAFANPHSLFPTFTTPNASAMATGHYLGDTGDFSNTIFAGFNVPSARFSKTPFLENDLVLTDIDEHFGGNFLDETAVLAAARMAGYGTAAIGKLGPVSIMDVTDRSGAPTVVVDDATGHFDDAKLPVGIPLPAGLGERIKAATGRSDAPDRGANGVPGDGTHAGTTVANVAQQQFFADVATKVVLPEFARLGKPFVLVFWSRDPDGTQHNQGDSLGQLSPGINGPTSMAAIRNADDNLRQIREALAALGLAATTDVIVSADHGFSTISKESRTSPSASDVYADVPAGQLPPGFVALDIAKALGLPITDPDSDYVTFNAGEKKHPARGDALVGTDFNRPSVVVAANGGSDLVYLPSDDARAQAPRVIAALLAQDYVSGLFVDDALGTFPGTLPLSAIGLKGSALTPVPSIVVNFRSFATGCSQPERCTAEVADSTLQQGQGMHGSFSRADTANFMAAAGPDFRSGYVDRAPVSNADVGMTAAALLKLQIAARGTLLGRVVSEAMRGAGNEPSVKRDTVTSPAAAGLSTIVRMQSVGGVRYFDAAGFAGRTVGL